ncbi:MAG: methyltransferase domain-containing protein [Chloroflexi bacterium]|nr:methyltransferase domain-containing protein [Chloroflexota bacterium]
MKDSINMDTVQQTIQTYDKIAHDYCTKTRQAKFLDWEETYIKKLMSYIPTPRPLILDVGCADGRHSIMIDRNGGKATGIDLSKSMLIEARALHPKGNFRQMDMRELTFNDHFFDGLWSSGSIYHVTKADVKKVIKEFRRVLKPGGVAAINFKLGQGEGMQANPKSYSGSPRYFAYYTEDEMKDIFASFGFEELNSCTYPEEMFGENNQMMWFRREVPPVP